MRFLIKDPNSSILEEGLTYNYNYNNNRKLTKRLKKEQRNFCAYTEQYIEDTDAAELEHFNSKLKYNDDYYNYYVVTRAANAYKMKNDNRYKKQAEVKASFFGSLFHQRDEIFRRMRYVKGEYTYEEIDEQDIEAKELIKFLGFNDERLVNVRRNHIKKLKNCFKIGNFTNDQILSHLQDYPCELSYITALQAELEIDLVQLLDQIA